MPDVVGCELAAPFYYLNHLQQGYTRGREVVISLLQVLPLSPLPYPPHKLCPPVYTIAGPPRASLAMLFSPLVLFWSTFGALSFAQSSTITNPSVPSNSSVVYQAIYQPHSNSTPLFHNLTGQNANPLITALLASNGSLERRALMNDQPAGVCAPGSPCTNGACCSNTGLDSR
jgi:hypothetical protein